MRLGEKFCLCAERGMIATPPMNQEHRWKARVTVFISKSDSVFVNQLHKLPELCQHSPGCAKSCSIPDDRSGNPTDETSIQRAPLLCLMLVSKRRRLLFL